MRTKSTQTVEMLRSIPRGPGIQRPLAGRGSILDLLASMSTPLARSAFGQAARRTGCSRLYSWTWRSRSYVHVALQLLRKVLERSRACAAHTIEFAPQGNFQQQRARRVKEKNHV